MSTFTQQQLDYLADDHLGRLATVDEDGQPHAVPVGYAYNPQLDTIDIGGRDFANTRKFKNVTRQPKVCLIVDDVLPPWRPRAVQVRGCAEAIDAAEPVGGGTPAPIIRITPTTIITWGLDHTAE